MVQFALGSVHPTQSEAVFRDSEVQSCLGVLSALC